MLDTAEDWWTLYGQIKEDVQSYIDTSHTVGGVAAHPQARLVVAESLLDYYRAHPSKTIREVMDTLEEARDANLAHLLESIWAAAPDSPEIHSWPSWSRFCDLCSEAHLVLNYEYDFDEYTEDEEVF